MASSTTEEFTGFGHAHMGFAGLRDDLVEVLVLIDSSF